MTGCDLPRNEQPGASDLHCRSAGQVLPSAVTFADTTVEPNETFNVNLTSISGTAGAVIEHPTGKGLDVNDDLPTPPAHPVGTNPYTMAIKGTNLLVLSRTHAPAPKPAELVDLDLYALADNEELSQL